ncbi:MAG: hypothetical protein ACXWXC_03325 [Aeromicrobium sp.]
MAAVLDKSKLVEGRGDTDIAIEVDRIRSHGKDLSNPDDPATEAYIQGRFG